METLELFSGAGGMALGLKNAGFNCHGLLEQNKDACQTLRKNFRANVFETDICEFDYSEMKKPVELIAGGPPCQPFSLAGKHRGKNDRRDMFPEAVRAINSLRPRAFIFENVRGLLRESFASYFEYIILRLTYPSINMKEDESWIEHLGRLERLKSSGVNNSEEYQVLFRCLNAADYGVPQKRERVFIVGFRKDLDISWSFPEATNSLDSLLFSKFVSKEYWEKNNASPSPSDMELIQNGKLEERLRRKFGLFEPLEKPWVTVREALGDLPEPLEEADLKYNNHILKRGAKSYPGHTGSPLDEPSKALKAGVHGVPGGENTVRLHDGNVRYFTVREAARVQTFPDNFDFSGAWSENMRQLGNAVPVKLASLVGHSVYRTLVDL